jgi:hypothetical protein
MKASGPAALNVLPSPVLCGNRQIIFQRATEMWLPAIYQSPEAAEEGERRYSRQKKPRGTGTFFDFSF